MKDLDLRLLQALRSTADSSDAVGPQWLQRALVDLTALGGHTVLATLVLLVAGLLVIERRRGSALWLIFATAGSMVLSHGLKLAFGRTRPEVVDHLVVVVTPSFPSGHALLSAAVYLMLAAVVGREFGNSASRHYLVAVAVLLTGVIGLSRVYLGVHWPSDILGGWLVGAVWAWGCWRLRGPASAQRTRRA